MYMRTDYPDQPAGAILRTQFTAFGHVCRPLVFHETAVKMCLRSQGFWPVIMSVLHRVKGRERRTALVASIISQIRVRLRAACEAVTLVTSVPIITCTP